MIKINKFKNLKILNSKIFCISFFSTSFFLVHKGFPKRAIKFHECNLYIYLGRFS